MVARPRPQPHGLRFDRNGEEPDRLRADDGRDALLFALAMLIKLAGYWSATSLALSPLMTTLTELGPAGIARAGSFVEEQFWQCSEFYVASSLSSAWRPCLRGR